LQKFWRLTPWQMLAIDGQLELLRKGTNLICSHCCGAGRRPLTADHITFISCQHCGSTGIEPTTKVKGA
jgi:hypothetical protein